ncbi:hypothetical protein ADUPG1_011110 [Aduncisulcus paluster]|uniref:Uncharacterized protein n=1 Tax=Aduncisulcus paluster TaxID=2918883 RepID=A0ABQ5JUE3_9EUKA|nr:hypothetical protein ADUPG1_011110 [Aduncisulcus paluster]
MDSHSDSSEAEFRRVSNPTGRGQGIHSIETTYNQLLRSYEDNVEVFQQKQREEEDRLDKHIQLLQSRIKREEELLEEEISLFQHRTSEIERIERGKMKKKIDETAKYCRDQIEHLDMLDDENRKRYELKLQQLSLEMHHFIEHMKSEEVKTQSIEKIEITKLKKRLSRLRQTSFDVKAGEDEVFHGLKDIFDKTLRDVKHEIGLVVDHIKHLQVKLPSTRDIQMSLRKEALEQEVLALQSMKTSLLGQLVE